MKRLEDEILAKALILKPLGLLEAHIRACYAEIDRLKSTPSDREKALEEALKYIAKQKVCWMCEKCKAVLTESEMIFREGIREYPAESEHYECPKCGGECDEVFARQIAEAALASLDSLDAVRQAAQALYRLETRDTYVTPEGRPKPEEWGMAWQTLGEALGCIGVASTDPGAQRRKG